MTSRAVALCTILVVAACQTAPPGESPGTAAGTTTTTRGSSTVVSSETTRADTTRSTGGVTVTVDRASYAAGATVTMRIISQSRDTLGFNQCSSRTVEKQVGGGWTAHPEPGRMCTMELRMLMPGETQTATTDLPKDLTPGTYRIVMSFSSQGTGASTTVRAVTPTFRVS